MFFFKALALFLKEPISQNSKLKEIHCCCFFCFNLPLKKYEYFLFFEMQILIIEKIKDVIL